MGSAAACSPSTAYLLWARAKVGGSAVHACVPPVPPPCRSDILTPLPAFGIPFEIDDNKGPLLDSPIRSAEQLKQLHAIDLQQLSFVGESLGLIRQEVAGRAAVLGFVGCPWTLATYVVEGASSSIYKNIKTMMFNGGCLRGGARGPAGAWEPARHTVLDLGS